MPAPANGPPRKQPSTGRRQKARSTPVRGRWVRMMIIVLTSTIVFAALLFLDTGALLHLLWIGLKGELGFGARLPPCTVPQQRIQHITIFVRRSTGVRQLPAASFTMVHSCLDVGLERFSPVPVRGRALRGHALSFPFADSHPNKPAGGVPTGLLGLHYPSAEPQPAEG